MVKLLRKSMIVILIGVERVVEWSSSKFKILQWLLYGVPCALHLAGLGCCFTFTITCKDLSAKKIGIKALPVYIYTILMLQLEYNSSEILST